LLLFLKSRNGELAKARSKFKNSLLSTKEKEVMSFRFGAECLLFIIVSYGCYIWVFDRPGMVAVLVGFHKQPN